MYKSTPICLCFVFCFAQCVLTHRLALSAIFDLRPLQVDGADFPQTDIRAIGVREVDIRILCVNFLDFERSSVLNKQQVRPCIVVGTIITIMLRIVLKEHVDKLGGELFDKYVVQGCPYVYIYRIRTVLDMSNAEHLINEVRKT